MHKNGDLHQLNLFLFINIYLFFTSFKAYYLFINFFLQLYVLFASLFFFNRTLPAYIHVKLRDRLEYLVCSVLFIKRFVNIFVTVC